MFCFVGKNLTIDQLWKKVCSLIKEGHLPCCNAKLQVGNSYFTIFTHVLLLFCVVPENIHTSPMEGIFLRHPPPPLWKFQ